jgi:hypothetical protein
MVVFLWGDPIYISRDASPEETEAKRIELETTLIQLTEKADKIACGK